MDDKKALFGLIAEKVHNIKSQLVILDRDLAGLYGVSTGRLNETVKRNIKRFDNEDTMFQLSNNEKAEVIANCDNLKGLKFTPQNPYAFTELGVAKLSSVLDSNIAIRVNDQIMRYFIHMRKLELYDNDFKKYVEAKFNLLEEKLKKSDINFEIIFSLLDSYKNHPEIPYKTAGKIGFKKTEDKLKQMKANIKDIKTKGKSKSHTNEL